jgi:NAD(P)-dependent dehydrogenase (short-subunit alcohol dehydrogenase family)
MSVESQAIRTDVTKEEDAIHLVETTIREFGTLDILVNNAGVSRAVPFVEITEQEWNRVFDVNVKGVYLCSKAAIPHLIKQKSGKIVNMSSMVGKEAFHYLCITRHRSLQSSG